MKLFVNYWAITFSCMTYFLVFWVLMEKLCLPMLCNNIWVHILSWTTAGNKTEIQTKMCLVFAYGCIFIQYLPCILIHGLKMACLMHANLNYKWDLVYLPWLNIDSCLSRKQFFEWFLNVFLHFSTVAHYACCQTDSALVFTLCFRLNTLVYVLVSDLGAVPQLA